MAAAKAVLPANGTVLASTSQPVTLTVQNAVTTQPTLPVSDTFEIATDSAFAHIVVTRTIPQSAGGQTSVTLDPLPPSTYFWRVRASAGGAVVTSTSGTFRIAAVLLAPLPALPANGILIGHLDQPVTLAVQNPAMPPTVTEITDTFDVATDTAFTAIVASTSVPQAIGARTSVTLSVLGGGATYYWRVRTAATDAIGVTSATAAFRIGPAIASGPYLLIFTVPYDFDNTAAGCHLAPAFEFQLVGGLTSVAQTLVFTAPGLPGPYGPVSFGTMQLRFAASQVSGSIVGCVGFNPAPSGCDYFAHTDREYPRMPVDVTGSINPVDAHLTGSVDGYLLVSDIMGERAHCHGTFPWSLAPR
jgi:hypothetical protein